MSPLVSFLLFDLLISIATIHSGSTYVGGCMEAERKALLSFKQDLTDPSNRLSSWNGDGDCCEWAAVVCNNTTGHVLQLKLENPHLEYFTSDYYTGAEYEAYNGSKLGGKINPSLLDLKHLIHLDLSFNDFQGLQIPAFLGSMHNLRYLNLSASGFQGMIPHQLGNLSYLQYLDLNAIYFGDSTLYVENLMWISHLSLLKHLDLSFVDLSKAADHWLLKINSLSFLETLQLEYCELQHFSQISFANFSSLTTLVLRGNQFDNSLIPSWIFGLSDLFFLDLGDANFQGPIPSGFENLTSLRYLDLTFNNLNSSRANWLSRFSHLEYLSLAGNDLQDSFLRSFERLCNLTSLRHLDLSSNNLNSSKSNWLSRFSNLEYLSLAGNDLQDSFLRSFERLHNLTSLRHLGLSSNNLNFSIPNWLSRFSNLESLFLASNNLQDNFLRSFERLCNLTSLRHLDLSSNNLNFSTPDWLSRFNNLESLSLSNNNLQGSIPRSFGRLCNLRSFSLSDVGLRQNMSQVLDIFSGCVADRLEYLDFSYNQVFGHLTEQLGRFQNLKTLDLGKNSIFGQIPSSFGKLSSLRSIYLDDNKFNGTLSPVHFANLTRLKSFSVYGNSLTLKANPDWVPPFQLVSLSLGQCHVGPQFPSWLQSQKTLYDLDMSNCGISDVIPDWFWKNLSHFYYLNLSHNQIYGEIPDLTNLNRFLVLDLSSNKISGSLPIMSNHTTSLDLSHNALSGSISRFLCYGMNETRSTQILILENNSFCGELPDCWINWHYLAVLNLGNNNFTGKLPTSMGFLGSLESLMLRKNRFYGVTPFMSLRDCTKLEALDVAENQFSGSVPVWIGERFPSMKILILRSNKFHGYLPKELCMLASLQILDLADNSLSGNIPRCVNNFSAMVTVNHSVLNYIYYLSNGSGNSFIQVASLVWKGNEYEYQNTLNLVRAIDLSKNNFSGEIPREVASLGSLGSLNLSHNSFSGRIPKNIGDLRLLDSMDFSANQLSDEIPQSLSKLTFLGYLNLSNNKLTGKIPSSTQLQTFDPSAFAGNDLCGSPLPKNCTETVPVPENAGNGRGRIEVDWFYVSMALGFVVGFWGLIGPLIINRRWRFMYSVFLDRLEDKFCSLIRKCF